MSARTILKHLHQQGRMTDYQFDVINRNLKERPQGHWIKTDNMLNIWKCSECNEEWCSEVGGNPLEYDYHYCPNCGADMRGRR